MRRITESFTRRVLRLQTRRGVDPAETTKIPAKAEGASGRFAMNAWAAFWADFRPDEQEVEVSHYRRECADLQARIDALPAGTNPDAWLSSSMMRRIERLRRDRFQDLTERIDDLSTSHKQATGRYEAAALNGAQRQNYLERTRQRLHELLADLGLSVAADEPVPRLLERLVEALPLPPQPPPQPAPKATSARLSRLSGRRAVAGTQPSE